MAGPQKDTRDDRQDAGPGRLPFIVSIRGHMLWSVRIVGQRDDTRFVLRLTDTGDLRASIITVPSAE